MKAIEISTSLTTTFRAGHGNTRYLLDPGVTIQTSSPLAMDAHGGADGRSFVINGTLDGEEGALQIGTPGVNASHTHVVVGAGGQLTANAFGILAVGNQDLIDNKGSIDTDRQAVAIIGNGNEIRNSGTIAGGFQGVIWQGNNVSFSNSGTVTADEAVVSVTRSGQHAVINNSGLIAGEPGVAILGGDGLEKVINTGEIKGDVLLGAGNDIFNGRKGIASGTIDGEAGNDVLVGGFGSDRLVGGLGKDVMTGGGSADVFVFNHGFGKDVITDFRSSGGDRDVIDLTLMTEFHKIEDIVSHTEARNGDAIIDFDGGDVLILRDVQSLEELNFKFAL